MPEENNLNQAPNSNKDQKVVEKYYIEVNPTGFNKFLHGLLGGLGWGVGITLGTSAFIVIVGFLVSKIDFVPVLGQFLADVIKSAQHSLK